MRVPLAFRRSSVGFNMTPLIDVVFQLIIFFLLSSHLVRQETQLELDLPRAESAQELVETQVPRVTVNVLADGTLMVSGRELDAAQLQQRLVERLREEGAELELRIRADRQVPYRAVEPVLLASARAGIWNVKFSVYRPEEAP